MWPRALMLVVRMPLVSCGRAIMIREMILIGATGTVVGCRVANGAGRHAHSGGGSNRVRTSHAERVKWIMVNFLERSNPAVSGLRKNRANALTFR